MLSFSFSALAVFQRKIVIQQIIYHKSYLSRVVVYRLSFILNIGNMGEIVIKDNKFNADLLIKCC